MSIVVPTLPLPDPTPADTSGVVGQKFIDTIMLVQSAARRCGYGAERLTAEDLEIALDNTQFILSALSNKGVNLWAVDRQSVSIVEGQVSYPLALGTERIINIVHRENKRLNHDSQVLSGQAHCTTTFAESTIATTVGFKITSPYSGRMVIEHSLDGVNWTLSRDLKQITLGIGWHWHTFDPAVVARHFRVRDSEAKDLSFVDMLVANGAQDIPLVMLNRDSYTAIPDKTRRGEPNTYYFEKKITTQISLWPVAEDETAQIILWSQRRIQDVGTLAHKLEIPDRWHEAIIWALAKNLCFELKGVSSERITLCTMEAAKALSDAELGESDNSPMYIQPNISGYTA